MAVDRPYAYVLTFLAVFWVMWVYSEVREYLERSKFDKEVHDFINAGDRFTSEDGSELQRRLLKLEAEYHAHLEHSAKFTEKIQHNERDLTSLSNRVIRLEDAELDKVDAVKK